MEGKGERKVGREGGGEGRGGWGYGLLFLFFLLLLGVVVCSLGRSLVCLFVCDGFVWLKEK